ncbi:hypothetical protein KY285_001513 [Solanum tuberosum]|nr:hypothetical protein KY289_001793 [Solanum tuberosum]KAH0765642.1 hypothetical protein KY285_001513 [Solanum tuberosum]
MDQNVSHGVEPVKNMKPSNSPGEFAVECARCYKWRYIPSKEKYEEIREHILELPFYCETTREWHSNKKCDDPPDVTEDESGLKWAIDAPNIPQPPPGWERLIKFRTKVGTRYYNSPSKQQLRSKTEVEKYLEQHPEDATQSAKLDQFSFQIPRSLEEDYVVKKRCPAHSLDDINGAYDGMNMY